MKVKMETVVIQFTMKDMGRLPRSTRANQIMRPKKGKGSYRRSKKGFE